MTSGAWAMFPFSTISKDGLTSGSIWSLHEKCESCTVFDCLNKAPSKPQEVMICRFGLGYAKINDDRFVIGAVVTDLDKHNQQSKKRVKSNQESDVKSRVKTLQILSAIEAVSKVDPSITNDIQKIANMLASELSSEPKIQEALAEMARKELLSSLNSYHELRQFVILIKHNAESMQTITQQNLDFDDVTEKFKSIFYLANRILANIRSLEYLSDIETSIGLPSVFGVHPALYSYIKMYDSAIKSKNLTTNLGNCRCEVKYYPDAVNTIFQALLDNAVKYAPAGSALEINFIESMGKIAIEFISLGPKIRPDELDKIFEIGYRAEAAQAFARGQGIGLSAVKQIATKIGIQVRASQDLDQSVAFPNNYQTKFSIELAVAT